MQRVAVFVDAGYFWVQVSSQVLGARATRNEISLDYPKMRGAFVDEVSGQFSTANLLRVYWYDGPGAHGKTADHHAIDELDDFKLRMGTRNGVGQQKAVDGLIIADMVSLTQSGAITDALLVTGDADLTPGVVAAQAMGLRVHLLTIGTSHATSPHLAAEVDRKVTWSQATVDSFAKRASPLPVPQPAITPAPLLVEPSVITAGPFDCASIARAAHSAIRSGAQAPLLAGLAANLPLPREIDSELLRRGRQCVNRSLTEPEKRALRNEFKKLL